MSEQMSAYTHKTDCSTSDPCLRCFEFGKTTEQARIIELLEEPYFLEPLANALISLSDLQFKLPDGNDVVEINFAIQAIYEYTHDLVALIKGEK